MSGTDSHLVLSICYIFTVMLLILVSMGSAMGWASFSMAHPIHSEP